MISSFHLNSNISDVSLRIFIENSIINFYKEIENHCQMTGRKDKYHLIEYGEMTMVNLFINGIIRSDELNRYAILNEFGIEKIKENQTGRADIIIEDTFHYEVYYIEAKKVSSNESVPITDEWGKEVARKYYDTVLEQANKYLKADFQKYDHYYPQNFYSLALIFDFTRFQDEKFISEWNFDKLLENEFYAFKTFTHNEDTLGLACYGILEKNNAE